MRTFFSPTRERAPQAPLPAVAVAGRFALLATFLVLSGVIAAAEAHAQGIPEDRVLPAGHRMNLAGPRVGLTYLGGGIVDSLAATDIDISAIVTQFG